MKRNYLMTGMKYPCKGDVRLLKSTLEHLEKTMPEMLVVKTYNKYGAVLKAVEADDEAETEAMRGVISDLPFLYKIYRKDNCYLDTYQSFRQYNNCRFHLEYP